MEYVTLGKTGLKISRLGFGGIPIQRIDAAAAEELLEAVRAAGINYIDTARGYTVSEELIGQADAALYHSKRIGKNQVTLAEVD